MLTIYLGSRELISKGGVVEPLKGILYIDSKLLTSGQKIYGQLTLTFRWVKRATTKINLSKMCRQKFRNQLNTWKVVKLFSIHRCVNQLFSKHNFINFSIFILHISLRTFFCFISYGREDEEVMGWVVEFSMHKIYVINKSKMF